MPLRQLAAATLFKKIFKMSQPKSNNQASNGARSSTVLRYALPAVAFVFLGICPLHLSYLTCWYYCP